MPTKVLIVFHSLYTHVYHLAEAVAAVARGPGHGGRAGTGRRDASPRGVGEDARRRGQEGVRPCARGRPERPGRGGRRDPRDPHEWIRHRLDAGVPRRDRRSLGPGALVGKVGSAFTSTASQHGGQETTLAHLHTFFYHQGMVVAGVPYTAQELLNLDEISGGTPYGRHDHRRPEGRAFSDSQRARHRALPGATRRRARRQAAWLSRDQPRDAARRSRRKD